MKTPIQAKPKQFKQFDCIVCNGKFLPIGEDHVPVMVLGKSICSRCLANHDGPGKFETYSGDPEALATAVILQWLVIDGSYHDDSMWAEGWGCCTLIDKYLVIEDDRGSVTYEEYRDVTEAQKRYGDLFAEGWGADEHDAYITDEPLRGYGVSFEGKYLGNYPRYNRARAAVRLAAYKSGYYPSCWHISDHGNLSLVNY